MSDVEASVWRLSENGLLISSVVERYAAQMADSDRNAIYFYAELGSPTELVSSPETVSKVYDALAAQGMSEGQALRTLAALQKVGVIFRERAI